MATYVIGDVQGCYDELQRLLDLIEFNESTDQLWFTGDLVNRGPKSLEVLRFVRNLGDSAVTVLGNHDLHMLAAADHVDRIRKKDTFHDVLNAPDCAELLNWLRHQPLLHYDFDRQITMIHAGLPPQWDVYLAHSLANEVQSVLQSDEHAEFFRHMYGDEPSQWRNSHSGWERLRFITNCLTRLRFCDAEGHVDLKPKGPPGTQGEGFMPWFTVPQRRSADSTILIGHWAALGAKCHGNVWSVDSGCAWGGALSALRIEGQMEFFSIPCEGVADIS